MYVLFIFIYFMYFFHVIYLFTHLFIYLFIYLFIHSFIYLFLHLYLTDKTVLQPSTYTTKLLCVTRLVENETFKQRKMGDKVNKGQYYKQQSWTDWEISHSMKSNAMKLGIRNGTTGTR